MGRSAPGLSFCEGNARGADRVSGLVFKSVAAFASLLQGENVGPSSRRAGESFVSLLDQFLTANK